MSVSAITNPVRLAHSALIAEIAAQRPHVIQGNPDAADAAERKEHIEAIAKALGAYVVAICDHLDVHEIDGREFADRLSDIVGDTIAGPLMRAAERLREEESARSEPRGSVRAEQSMEA